MNDELNVDQKQEPENTPEQKDIFVERAMELGWRPEEEWQGPPEDFIDAKEFVRRKPLFEKIEHQSRELKALRGAFDAFKTHHSKVKEVEYNRALAALKAEKRRALSDGETERALVIEDKIDEIVEQKSQFESEAASVQTPQEASPRPEFVRWQQENSWYGKDKAMTVYADTLGVDLSRQGHSPEEVLAKVTREVRSEFAHKLTNTKRERAGAVEGSSRSGANTAEEFKLSDDERQIMNKIVAMGGITKEDYIKELKRVRG
jgi:hypothetical protein